jgi:hypothetical protein
VVEFFGICKNAEQFLCEIRGFRALSQPVVIKINQVRAISLKHSLIISHGIVI